MGTLALKPVQVDSLRRASGDESVLATYGPPNGLPVISLVDASTTVAQDGVHVSLTWRSERQAPLNYALSVRLNTVDGERIASRDLPPLLGVYPTSLWRPGELITDRVLIGLPAGASFRPGEDQLEVVLYDRATLAAAGTAVVAPALDP